MKNKKGFSIIEIIVVLLILAILAAIAWPSISGYFTSSKEEIYLAEGEKVLSSCQVEAKKYVSKNGSLSEQTLSSLKANILKRASLSGNIVYIYANSTNEDIGFFCYQVEDESCYIIYDNQELYVSDSPVDRNEGSISFIPRKENYLFC